MNIFNLISRKMRGYIVFLIKFGLIIASKRKLRKKWPTTTLVREKCTLLNKVFP